MALKDIQIKKFYEKKNEFESFIYKSKEKLNDYSDKNKEYIFENQLNELHN